MARLSTKMLIDVSDADDEDPGERHEHRGAADRQRHARGDQRPEHEDQREGRQRQRDQLAALQVGLGHRLDIAVERRARRRSARSGPGPGGGARRRPGWRRASRRAGGRGRRCRTRCDRRPRPGEGRASCDRTRVTCGAPATSPVAAAMAARHSGVPAVNVSEVYRRTKADASTPSWSCSTCFALADSRSSRMKPPADRAPGARGASGRATRMSTAHAATIHQRRRTANRPRASKLGELVVGTCGARVACYRRSRQRPSGAASSPRDRSARIDRAVRFAPPSRPATPVRGPT